jgi:hypothetical protein
MSIGIQVVFDAAEPAKLADFWALALGYVIQPPPPGFDSWEDLCRAFGVPEDQWADKSAVVDPDGAGPRLFFQRVPEGKIAKNRVHLDINASAGMTDPEARWQRVTEYAEKLVAAGATVLDEVRDPLGNCIVLRDPEGNEFCVQ